VKKTILLLLLFLPLVQAKITPNSIQYTYEEPMQIGDEDLILTLMFDGNCEITKSVSFPRPDINCWQVNFPTKKAVTGDTIKLYGVLDVKLVSINARVKYSEGNAILQPNWKLNLLFNFTDQDFLEIKGISIPKVIVINDDADLHYQIKNDFVDIDGGIYEISTNNMFFQTEKEFKELKIKEGSNVYKYKTKAELLGENEIKANPYIYFLGHKLFDDREAIAQYKVIPNIEFIETSTRCENKICPSGFSCQSIEFEGEKIKICVRNPKVGVLTDFTKLIFINTIGVIFIIFFIVVIGLLIYKKKKPKRKAVRRKKKRK